MPLAYEQIKKDIVEALFWDNRVDASDVMVRFDEGRVELLGTVPSHEARRAAEENACRVAGALRVDNHISLRTITGWEIPSDALIRHTLRQMIQVNPDLADTDLQIEVEDGVVTLRGPLDAYWKKRLLENLALGIYGVVDIQDKLSVAPTRHADDKTIAWSIVDALDRNALVDAEAVEVEVDTGTVTLKGIVPSDTIAHIVEDVAEHTPGVRAVHSEVLIG